MTAHFVIMDIAMAGIGSTTLPAFLNDLCGYRCKYLELIVGIVNEVTNCIGFVSQFKRDTTTSLDANVSALAVISAEANVDPHLTKFFVPDIRLKCIALSNVISEHFS